MNSFRVREFEREDIPTLSNYLAARFPYSKDQNLWKERFDMWWFDNPSLTPETPIGWVLERDDSSIAGFMGSIPVKFRVGERECLAAAGTSWHVEADVRGIYSLQLLSAFHRQQEAALFIQTTPTPPVREILAKFQYSFQPFPSRNVEYFYVISYAQSLKFLMHYFSKESPQAPSLITPMIKRLLRQARENLKIGGKRTPTMARILESSGPDTLVCSECTTCGSDYKEIGDACRQASTLGLSRDPETLNWLYFSKAVERKRIVIQCHNTDTGALVGYMAFDIKEPLQSNISILQLMDLFIPDRDEAVFRSLMNYALDLGKKRDAALVLLWAADEKMNSTLDAVCRIRGGAEYPYYYKWNQKHPLQYGEPSEFTLIPSNIDPDRGCL